MSAIFNFMIIIMVFLIAYWWSNQGFFSGLLHMAAVIVAGAVSISVWELLVWDLAMGNTAFMDNYISGLSFVFVFVGVLVLLRVGTDRLVPENLSLPPALDMAGGFVTGAVAGILAVGLLLTGIGFLQRPHEFMGYKGYGRSKSGTSEITEVGAKMWLPADWLATGFYELASVTGLRPDIGGTPLRQYNPELYKQSTLLRDTVNGDKGQVYFVPDAAVASTPMVSEFDGRRYITVPVEFDATARDFGRQLTVAKGQARLVGKSYGTKTPEIIYPSYWVQDTAVGGQMDAIFPGFYRFDDMSNYVTSVPGREQTKAKFIFEVPEDFEPNFIQLKGLRLALDEPRDRDFLVVLSDAQPLGRQAEFDLDPGGDISSAVKVGANLKFLRSVSKNKMPSSMSEEGGYLTEGYMTVRLGNAGRVGRGLQIRGISQTEGTTIIQVDVSRYSPANLFSEVRKLSRPGDRLQLTDTDGNTYAPIGYYYKGREGTEIKLDRTNFLRTLEELGTQPASGSTQQMVLFFEVTNGSTLDELYLGDVMVGYIEGVQTRP
ncbi:MAG: hypothetical protein MK116_11570 [Phycisphaerales bacterium]|nr:hypothetical protein [Phycisphaerales bacterium]